MKEPIEELFKQSLGGHEMPFNPEAWKAMSARLDVVSQVVKPTSNLKYYLGAAVIGVAAVTTYLLVSVGNTTENTSEPIANETRTEQTTSQTNDPSTVNNEIKNDNSSVTQNPTENSSSSDNGTQVATITNGNSEINTQGTQGSTKTGDLTIDLVEGPTNRGTGVTTETPEPKSNGSLPVITVAQSKMTMPAVRDLCLNEETTVTNPNGKEIYILDGLNNVIKTIPANKSVVFQPTVVGNYSLGYRNDATIESASNFRVNRTPDAEFSIDLINKYENGLPSTHVQAIGGQGTYVWQAERQSASGVEADMHFYNKGEQTITLTVDNGQCAVTVEKSIFIEEDFNLMAVTGFTPMSIDPKKSTFMPFALTQRPDVNFVLTIIDGRDGGTVYQTSDASLPWDGTDIRSGRRSETPQVYVWKAVILNPAANEPSEYRGTITMN